MLLKQHLQSTAVQANSPSGSMSTSASQLYIMIDCPADQKKAWSHAGADPASRELCGGISVLLALRGDQSKQSAHPGGAKQIPATTAVHSMNKGFSVLTDLQEAMRMRKHLLAGLQEDLAAMPHIVFRTVHIVLQVSKCQLGLNHPELGQMPCCVAVLSPALISQPLSVSSPALFLLAPLLRIPR